MMRSTMVMGAMALAALAPAVAAQPPGGRGGRPGGSGSFRRPAIFEVTGEKLLELNPIAKLLAEGKKLALTDQERVRLDSLDTALAKEVAPFAARVDSLRPRGGGSHGRGAGEGGGQGRRRPGFQREGGESGERPGMERFEQLQLTVGMIKLRYDAALLSAEQVLGADRHEALARIVEKGQRKMEEYAAPLGSPR